VQVPAQPVDPLGALDDEVVAVVGQQLHLPRWSVPPRDRQVGLAVARPAPRPARRSDRTVPAGDRLSARRPSPGWAPAPPRHPLPAGRAPDGG
jgi:hypothetical protein